MTGSWAVLREVLIREWMAQSDGREPLRVTSPVREAVELATTGPRGGALEVYEILGCEVPTPDALLARLGDRLPLGADAWGERMLRRLALSPTAAFVPVAAGLPEDPLEAPTPAVPEEGTRQLVAMAASTSLPASTGRAPDAPAVLPTAGRRRALAWSLAFVIGLLAFTRRRR
jgi:hypothetical protein